MVILGPECVWDILKGDPVGLDVMNSLDVEGLLDLGVRGDDGMDGDQGGDAREEQEICRTSAFVAYY